MDKVNNTTETSSQSNPMFLSLSGYISSEETFHIFRITHGINNPLGLHTHEDFAEVFFVESGEGFHMVNGERIRLQPGVIAFIRPEDKHTVVGKNFYAVVNRLVKTGGKIDPAAAFILHNG